MWCAGDVLQGSACHSRADIVFVVDSSGSINEHDSANWGRVKEFAKSVVRQLDVAEDRVRVGMVEFGNEAWIQFHLNEHDNADDINADIDRSSYSCWHGAAVAFRIDTSRPPAAAVASCRLC